MKDANQVMNIGMLLCDVVSQREVEKYSASDLESN